MVGIPIIPVSLLSWPVHQPHRNGSRIRWGLPRSRRPPRRSWTGLTDRRSVGMSKAADSTRFCGRMGCQSVAYVVAMHPVHGRIVTCWGCADGLEVVARVW